MTSCVTYVMVMITQSCDIEKAIKSSKIDNIIQHNNNMLVLWQAYVL